MNAIVLIQACNNFYYARTNEELEATALKLLNLARDLDETDNEPLEVTAVKPEKTSNTKMATNLGKVNLEVTEEEKHITLVQTNKEGISFAGRFKILKIFLRNKNLHSIRISLHKDKDSRIREVFYTIKDTNFTLHEIVDSERGKNLFAWIVYILTATAIEMFNREKKTLWKNQTLRKGST